MRRLVEGGEVERKGVWEREREEEEEVMLKDPRGKETKEGRCVS